MTRYILKFDIKSDWHIGSGEEIDSCALTLKDKNYLPYIPGKSCKGLLREAFELANNNDWFPEHQDIVNILFGNENRSGQDAQGLIQITSASLNDGEAQYLISEKNIIKHLYRTIQSTAINSETGTAKPTSLRNLQVAIPMQLEAELTLNPTHPNYNTDSTQKIKQNFYRWLSHVANLITEFGGKRHRGFGQVTITVTELKE